MIFIFSRFVVYLRMMFAEAKRSFLVRERDRITFADHPFIELLRLFSDTIRLDRYDIQSFTGRAFNCPNILRRVALDRESTTARHRIVLAVPAAHPMSKSGR